MGRCELINVRFADVAHAERRPGSRAQSVIPKNSGDGEPYRSGTRVGEDEAEDIGGDLQLSLANVRTRRDQVAEEAERTSSRVEAVDEEDSKTTAILVPGSHTQELGAAAGGAKATTMARLLEARPVPAGQSKTVAKSADSVLEPTPSADGKLASTATKPGADLPIMESGSIPESSTKPQEGVMSGGTSTAAVMGIQGTCPQSLERQRNAEKGDASTVTLQSGATEMATPAEVRPEARPRNEASRRITISEILSLRVLSSMSSQ
jgi:hypothetical protein